METNMPNINKRFKDMPRMVMMGHGVIREAQFRREEATRKRKTMKMAHEFKSVERSIRNAKTTLKMAELESNKRYKLLEQESSNLALDVHVATSTYHQRLDAKNEKTVMDNVQKIDIALKEREGLKATIEYINIKTRELDSELRVAKLKLKPLYKQLAIARATDAEKTSRRVELVEQKYGLQLAQNRRLKDTIDHLEGERDKVLRLCGELDKELSDLSMQLTVLTEKTKDTYEHSDMNKRNIDKMVEHMQKTTACFELEMQHLQFQINCLRRFERFITAKNKVRLLKNGDHHSKPTIQQQETDLINYRNRLQKIKNNMNEDDMQHTINVFIELEEENFSLFRNISATNDACHSIQMEIEELRAKHKAMFKQNMKNDQETACRKLELKEKIQTCKQQAGEAEKSTAATDIVIQMYIQGILAIMDNLGYTQKDINSLSGIYVGVEERNVRVFLAEIEYYVNNLFDLKEASDYMVWDQARKQEMTVTNPEHRPPRVMLVQRVVVMPPVHEEGDNVNDPVLPLEASLRPLAAHEMVHHIEEDLEIHDERDEVKKSKPSRTMGDPTGELLGDTSQSPPGSLSRATEVDVL